MPYIIIFIGIVLISISLYQGKNLFKSQKKNSFNDVLTKEIKNSEATNITLQLNELTSRINELENSLLLVNDSMDTFNNSKGQFEPEPKISENTNGNSADIDNVNDRIFKLHDSGRSIEEICSILNLGKGEVSLRLGLRRNKH